MTSARLEAFSDGVIAIIITITVLSLQPPQGDSWAAIAKEAPVFLAYALSFANVGLYWNNHHHLFQAAEKVDGRVLWANLFLLFWLSFTPFVIRWLDATSIRAAPTAAYGVIMAMAAVGWQLTQRAVIACNGPDSLLAKAVGADRKGEATLVLYALAVPLAFVHPGISIAIYIVAVLAWIIPDRRLERATRA